MAQSVEYSKRVAIDLTEKAPIQVLHVDDEAGFLKAAKQILEMQGAFRVDTASSAEEAMEKMRKKEFDVIVADYVMPGKDGLEFLKELRDSGNNIPFIMFTGKGREEVAIKALNLGADSYFNKIGGPETVYGELAHGILQVVENRRAENALRNSENKYRTLLENLPQKIFFKDKNSVYVACNENYARDLKIKPDEIAGKTDYDFYPKKLAEKYRADDRRLMESDKTEDIEEEYIQNGQKLFVHTVKTPVKDENGDVVGILGIFWDITERKKAEDALKESEGKFRNIFETANDCLIYLDRSGRILDVNRKAAQVFGGSRKELLGRHFTKVGVFSFRDIPILMSNFAKLLASRQATVNICVKNKKGQEIPLECSGSVMKIDDKPVGLMVIARDITERKKTEQELRDAREKWVSLTENTNDVIMILDGEGTIQYLNPTPLTPNPREATGKSVYEYVPREQHNIMRESLRKVFKTGKPESYEVSPNIQGIGTIWFNTKVVPIKHDKKTVSFILISTDITERKQAEESVKATFEKLQILNEKLGVVGKLTRHDARNKLSTVTMNTFLIRQKLADDSEVLKHLSEVESACGEVVRIFEFARIYEKIGVEELVYMDVAKTLEETGRLFSDLHNVVVVNDCRGLTVLADSLLRQLFYNLIDNSLKYGEKVSRIRVYYEETGKDQLKLVYEDDGVGIPKAEKEKIFKEGYGKGTGFGLYLIRKMCEVYGWTIRETGKQGKGAQFTITLLKVNKSGKINYRLHQPVFGKELLSLHLVQKAHS